MMTDWSRSYFFFLPVFLNLESVDDFKLLSEVHPVVLPGIALFLGSDPLSHLGGRHVKIKPVPVVGGGGGGGAVLLPRANWAGLA